MNFSNQSNYGYGEDPSSTGNQKRERQTNMDASTALPIGMRSLQSLSDCCLRLKEWYDNNPGGGNSSVYSNDFTNAINEYFAEYQCLDVIFSKHDTIPFGIYVLPALSPEMIQSYLLNANEEKLYPKMYSVEIDLGILTKIDDVDLCAWIIEAIGSMMNPSTVESVIDLINLVLTEDDKVLDIFAFITASRQAADPALLYYRAGSQYRNNGNLNSPENYDKVPYGPISIFEFAIVQTMRELTNILTAPIDEIGSNEYSKSCDAGKVAVNVAKKMRTELFGEEYPTIAPKMSVLRWAMNIYEDLTLNAASAVYTLKEAKKNTGSLLEKGFIDRIIQDLVQISIVKENTAFYEGFSLFKSLKSNGLRSLEDDLYEYKIRMQNCDDEDEAMYILRQINTRIAILQDYIENTDLSEGEARRWTGVIAAYKKIRYDLGKKKVGHGKSYGVFIDYDKIDQLYGD